MDGSTHALTAWVAMDLEFYIQGDDIPPLYDWTMLPNGNLKPMRPRPPTIGVLQVVLQSPIGQPSEQQWHALEVITSTASKRRITFYGNGFEQSFTRLGLSCTAPIPPLF